jgi:hypothetical protein
MAYGDFIRNWWKKASDEALELHHKNYQQALEHSENGTDIGAANVSDCAINLICISEEKESRRNR